MKHKTLSADVVGEPPVVVVMERRVNPDRRALWRGGRRDRDWQDRPDGAWSRVRSPAAVAARLARFVKGAVGQG